MPCGRGSVDCKASVLPFEVLGTRRPDGDGARVFRLAVMGTIGTGSGGTTLSLLVAEDDASPSLVRRAADADRVVRPVAEGGRAGTAGVAAGLLDDEVEDEGANDGVLARGADPEAVRDLLRFVPFSFSWA